MTPYVLATVYSIAALLLIYAQFKIKLQLHAQAPKEDRDYWEKMTVTFKKGLIVGAIGSGVAAIALIIKQPIIAEICCITLLASLVFPLATLSRKTAFRPCAETEKLQKRWQTILLLGAFLSLILTQFVFGYFNSLIVK